jgi:hypothetical protein
LRIGYFNKSCIDNVRICAWPAMLVGASEEKHLDQLATRLPERGSAGPGRAKPHFLVTHQPILPEQIEKLLLDIGGLLQVPVEVFHLLLSD